MINPNINTEVNNDFYQRLSTIFSDIGQVFLATMIIPFFTNKNFNEAYLALVMASVSWAVSLWIVKESK